jgi:hypothetical protein
MPLEAGVLLLAGAAAPIALYHLFVRRTPWLRFLFGLRPKLRVRAEPPAAAAVPVDYAHAQPPG